MDYSSVEKIASIYDMALEETEKDASLKKKLTRALLGASLVAGGGGAGATAAQMKALQNAPVHQVMKGLSGETAQTAKSIIPGVSGEFIKRNIPSFDGAAHSALAHKVKNLSGAKPSTTLRISPSVFGKSLSYMKQVTPEHTYHQLGVSR